MRPHFVLVLPPARPDTYFRLVRACRVRVVGSARDALTEELLADVHWQISNQAARAGGAVVAPRLEIGPEHVDVALRYVRRVDPARIRSTVEAGGLLGPAEGDLLERCVRRVEDHLASSLAS